MTEYVTTNIRLSKTLCERVKKLALEENKSLAQVVRESLVEYLIEPKPQRALRSAEGFDDPIFHIAELTQPEEVIVPVLPS